MQALGWDIGGANLKASNGATQSIELRFPLWKQPEELASALTSLADQFDRPDLWAVTMTGELADCFRTKREGVQRILESLRAAAGEIPLAIWTTTGEFVPASEAAEWPLLTAASNWLALATWVGRIAPEGGALLVDTGSTTTDVIPLVNGFPDPQGRTDLERLLASELVYTGWNRTPVAAISPTVEFRGQACPLAAELFATAADIHLLARDEHSMGDFDTANAGPATRDGAHDRLARMLCADREELTLEEVAAMARQLSNIQTRQIAAAINRVLDRQPGLCTAAVVSGSGEFLAREALQHSRLPESVPVHSLTGMLGPAHAAAACAYAIARLAAERLS